MKRSAAALECLLLLVSPMFVSAANAGEFRCGSAEIRASINKDLTALARQYVAKLPADQAPPAFGAGMRFEIRDVRLEAALGEHALSCKGLIVHPGAASRQEATSFRVIQGDKGDVTYSAGDLENSAARAMMQDQKLKVASLALLKPGAAKPPPAVAAQIDLWLIDHYRRCWSYFGLGGTQDYVPALRIHMMEDGKLLGRPQLLNLPKDGEQQRLADSAVRAVNKCNPMEIPARFKPFYDQGYKDRTIRFDPKELS